MRLDVSAEVPAVLVARFTAPEGARTAVRVEDVDGERTLHAVRDGGQVEVALVGLVAGEPFRVTPVVDGRDGEPLDAAAPPVPEDWPRFALALDEVHPDGAFLVETTDPVRSGVGIVDGDGRWRWWLAAPDDRTLAAPRPSRDGASVVFTSQDRARADVDQFVHVVALDGARRSDVALAGAHHMVEALDDGTFAWLAWDTRTVPWIDGAPAAVTADRVLVGDGDGDERYSFFDDHGPATLPCPHGRTVVSRQGAPTYEWTHANSLVWVPETDQLLVNSRLLDALVAIDRRTGAPAWQLGGDGATLALSDPADAFSHAHFSDAAADRVLVFDNGVHHDPPATRVVEYALDPDGGTARVTRELALPRFYSFLGDARWRSDGGLLVASAQPGNLVIYDAADRPVWRLDLEGGPMLGRVRELPDFLP